ncbi:transcriptional regulator, LysR family [Streptomyces sp. 2131.1]|uniref:LysR family transcriptional regulator n=1 Tax=Streptomyces sp. 2131.1 TaxID=1855346 RepID=UPI0008988006|nr:LysR family transcriptional regulator [Streptomyces sp. 2131.1]SEB62764.1 transcriptional regulator, LysR family [Streptomyces sp. 2131.1]
MELRDIEIFLTLAEELHFGRTAALLHVSQARVSQSIAKQERRLGTRLFLRSSRKVELTPIGAQLRDDLRSGYQQIQEGVARAAEAAAGWDKRTLKLGLHGPQPQDQAHLLERFRAQHPHTELVIKEMTFSDPFGPLRDGFVDVATAWLPVREPDLTVGPVLISGPALLMVRSDHPLTQHEALNMEDLADWTLPQCASNIPEYWQKTLVPSHTPSGQPIRRGPKVSTFQEVAAVVSSGAAICLVHEVAARYYPWPGLRYLRPVDAPTVSWALIWPTARATPAVLDFARLASKHRPAPQATE